MIRSKCIWATFIRFPLTWQDFRGFQYSGVDGMRKDFRLECRLIGDCFQEKKLFQAAYTYECLTEKKWVSMYDKTEAAGKEEA